MLTAILLTGWTCTIEAIESARPVHFIGDSHIARMPVTQLMSCLNAETFGYPGSTSRQIEALLIDELAPLDAIAILQVGYNDILQLNIPVPAGSEKKIVEDIVSLASKTSQYYNTVILQSIIQQPSSAEQQLSDIIEKINSMLEHAADSITHFSYLDVNASLTSESGHLREVYTNDLVHLNSLGYSILINSLCEELR